jgi:hypothetical protein
VTIGSSKHNRIAVRSGAELITAGDPAKALKLESAFGRIGQSHLLSWIKHVSHVRIRSRRRLEHQCWRSEGWIDENTPPERRVTGGVVSHPVQAKLDCHIQSER